MRMTRDRLCISLRYYFFFLIYSYSEGPTSSLAALNFCNVSSNPKLPSLEPYDDVRIT